ncbi:MAG: ABC transporter ATP-binding protein [Clostridiales bacterium]|nr:ABC transporter ATP-binding protein [Clostridiales bacterium]
MKKLLVYFKGYGRDAVLAPLFKLFEATLELFVPLVMAAVIDTGVAAGDKPYILKMGAVLLLLGALGLAAAITAQYFAARSAVGFAARLRHALFRKIETLSFTDLDTVGTATLLTRITSDVNQVQTGVNLALRLLLRSPFIVFGAMLMAFVVDATCALIFAAVIPLLSLVVFLVMFATIPRYRKVQQNLDGVLGKTRETLTGVRVLRAFAREEAEIDEFAEKNEALLHMQRFVGRISALMNPLTYVIINLAVLALLAGGSTAVDVGRITQGELMALVNYMLSILVELIKLANLIISITRALASAKRIGAVLELPEGNLAMAKAQGETSLPEGNDDAVTFQNVSLTYQGAGDASLENISFTVKKGQAVGIIGPTGSGKSSLVSLIGGFYEATEGTVSVMGRNVALWDAAALRRLVGLVPQKAVLFKGTVRDNLLFGSEHASDEALWEALRATQAEDFIRKKEGMLDAPVEQGGRNFSGGQKQRLTIARALVKKPPILILDDSASALDYATDAALRRAIREMPGSPTIFIVSQRAASVLHADLILVMDDGKAVGAGTHETLLSDCPVYREIYFSQFPKEAGKEGK